MISVKKVSKRIKDADVLSDVCIEVPDGTVVGLEGPNGSGKSMLMRCVAGLVHPTGGAVVVDNRCLFTDVEFPPSLGMLIENPAFLENRSGWDNLKILASIKGVVGDSEIAAILDAVGLDSHDRRTFRKYSLGMKQRLGIAAAFMEDPDVLLLDEPINALDNSGVSMFEALLGKAKGRGASILLSCYDKALLRQFSDEIYIMSEGRVVDHELVC